ncbi:hypothetical protein HPB49_022812 [Dermacentor silvarum]|uniref:Uncharacterized protein n=1 Tax=Dermacentor silvarum TaxID=543639 RepID=A0ACB8CTL4_DERSI|nr:hypothetical protein HPB49_022812 [Dermacentor silvarum]
MENDVQRRFDPPNNLLQREVYCWNRQYGCEVVLAVSEVCKHFRSECVHHSTFCPKCSETVLCSSLCAHIRSDCSTLVVASTSVSPQELSARDEMITTRATKVLLEKPVVEIKATLHSILSENNAQSNALNDLCQKMNIVMEALTRESRASARQTSQCFAGSAAQCSGIDESVGRRLRDVEQ